MQRIAGMTVTVKADGVSEAFYNGQRDRVVEAVREEMARQKERYDADMAQMKRDAELELKRMESELQVERDRADIQSRGRSRLQREKLTKLKESLCRRRGPIHKLLNAVELAWAYIWALTFGMVWVEIGERLGLWERIDD